jgi:hypothetical protein
VASWSGSSCPGEAISSYGGPVETALASTPWRDCNVSWGTRIQDPDPDESLVAMELADAKARLDELINQSPSLWWPNNHAWVVATEVDFGWTYVGGSAATIARILAEPRLDALPAKPSDKIAYNSDLPNSALDR